MPISDLLLYASAALFPLFILVERVMPARRQPRIAGWPAISA